MATYTVTIHDHIIYDYVIEADSRQEAEARAEESIMNEESHLWRQDMEAGWTEIGEIYNDMDEEV
jgi:hypothetical protein